jgi:hypothetical protein
LTVGRRAGIGRVVVGEPVGFGVASDAELSIGFVESTPVYAPIPPEATSAVLSVQGYVVEPFPSVLLAVRQ